MPNTQEGDDERPRDASGQRPIEGSSQAEDEKAEESGSVEEQSEQSFPASDPPSY